MAAPEALPTVAVVIPTRGGRAALLQRAVPKLLADPGTSELIIVLDLDDSDTEAVVRRYADSDRRVRWARSGSPAQTTLSREQGARDLGARLAESQVILALDDDVEPGFGLVSGHARHHVDMDARVVVGYMPVVPPASRRGGLRATAQLYADTYARECTQFQADPATVLLGLWGGNFSLPRRHWLRAAGDMPGSAGYHVDREFGLRLRRLGLSGVFDRDLRADHWYRRSTPQLMNDARSSGQGLARLRVAYPELALLDPNGQWPVSSARSSGLRAIGGAGCLKHAACARSLSWPRRVACRQLSTPVCALCGGWLPSAGVGKRRLVPHERGSCLTLPSRSGASRGPSRGTRYASKTDSTFQSPSRALQASRACRPRTLACADRASRADPSWSRLPAYRLGHSEPRHTG